jgi:hypothetical protein
MATTRDRIRPQPIPTAAVTREHEHAWTTESRHRTSEGELLYVRCTGCGARRIDLQSQPEHPPTALTRPIHAVGNNPSHPRVEPHRLKLG